MSVSLTQILVQQGYLTTEQYNYAYQIQQSQPVELRQPLAQVYLEQGFLGVEHIEYCLKIRQQYIMQGVEPDYEQYPTLEQPAFQEEQPYQEPVAGGMVNCKVCLSECQSSWAVCPFCGNNMR